MNNTTFGEFVLGYRWTIVILTLVLVSVFGYQIKNTEMTDDMNVFFAEDNPQLLALNRFKASYGETKNAFIAISPNDNNIFTNTNLALLEELTERSWEAPYSRRVDSLQNFQRTIVAEDDLSVDNTYRDAASLTLAQLADIRDYTTQNDVLAGKLVSTNGAIAAVNVTFNLPDGPGAREKRLEVIEFYSVVVDELKVKYPNVDIYTTGGIYVSKAFSDAMIQDGLALMPAMLGLMIFFMYLFLRSVAGMIGTVLVVVFSAVIAVGGTVWLGITLTNITSMAPIVILTVGVADSVHVLISMFQSMSQGKSKNEAIKETLRINHQPIFLTSLTTIIGFLSLNFNESPPFHDLGNEVAIGVVAAYLLSVFFLPAFLSLVPMKARKIKSGDAPIMEKLAVVIVSNYRVVLGAMIIVIVGLASTIPKLDFNDLFLEYIDESSDFRRTNDFLMKNLVGMLYINYDVDSGEEGGINNPAYIEDLSKFRKWLLTQPRVQYVNSYDSIVFELNKTMHGDDDSYYRTPESRELAAQYLLMYEMSLPMGRDVGNTITTDRRRTNLGINMENAKTSEIIELTKVAEAWALENAPNIKLSPAIGEPIMFAHVAKRNIVSMVGGAFLALFLISIVLLVALRNIKLGIMSLAPNVLPLVMAFGVWSIFQGELGMSGGAVLVIALGIIVDDTVHFFSKYLRAKRELNFGTEDAIIYSFRTVGVALLVTSTILVVGFSMLYGSIFKPTKDMGLLISLTVGLALVATFFMIPPLLLIFDKDKKSVVKNTEAEDVSNEMKAEEENLVRLAS